MLTKPPFMRGTSFGTEGRAPTIPAASRARQSLCAVATIAGIALVLRGLTGTAAQPTTVVSVTGGQIRGATIERGGAMFKGIPFARAPVGDQRWREPAPVMPWRGVKDAVEFTPPCAQSAMLQADLAPISSEDCLYLNVWTPDWPTRLPRPVMVWIPGGGNFGGTANAPRFNGEALAGHDVVVVTVNYRLSLFGFLAHPALTKESVHNASGNYGLLDQIAALQWVRHNIAQFGGNPDEVTIFGESAGSFDVSFLMTSPLAKGLFRRAIAESGTVTTLGDARSLSEAEGEGEALMNRVDVEGPRTLSALRQKSVTDILKVEPPYLTSPPRSLLAVVDGYVLPRQPSTVFSTGQAHRVPLIIGNAARERIPGTTLPSNLVATIRDTYGPLASEALALYGVVDGSSAPAHSRYGTAAEQWATDTSFRCSSVVAAEWHAAAGNRTYRYRVRSRSQGPRVGRCGSCERVALRVWRANPIPQRDLR